MVSISRGCIIFDLDGTLVDSREDLADAVNLTRRDFNLDLLSLETITSFVGNGARKLLERALSGSAVDVETALLTFKQHYQRKMLDKTALYPGVATVVPWLASAGWPLAVITNKPSLHCREILKHFGLYHYFVELIGADSGFPLKPEPDAASYLLSLTNSEAAASWMVGDNYTDMATARRAGMKSCFARYGFGQLRDETFDNAISSFSELFELFEHGLKPSRKGSK